MVEFDAFAGDIALGGLRNMMEIRILVCYLLSNVNEPMTRKQLLNCLTGAGLVNFFDLNQAIDDLLNQRMITSAGEGDESRLTATNGGKGAAETLSNTLLPSTRSRAVEVALRQITRTHAERETMAEIEKTEMGYIVHLAVLAGDISMLSCDLYAADILQAEQLRDGFLNDPASFYTVVVDGLCSGNR